MVKGKAAAVTGSTRGIGIAKVPDRPHGDRRWPSAIITDGRIKLGLVLVPWGEDRAVAAAHSGRNGSFSSDSGGRGTDQDPWPGLGLKYWNLSGLPRQSSASAGGVPMRVIFGHFSA